MMQLIRPKPKPLYNLGEPLIYNSKGEFGSKEDKIFIAVRRRYGRCYEPEITPKEWWYSGHLFEVKELKSKGVPFGPSYLTTLINASESSLIRLEELLEKEEQKK